MRAAAAVLLALAPLAAAGQGLPVFNDAAGFTVSAETERGIWVENAGRTFLCSMSDEVTPYLALSGCTPVLSEGQARDHEAWLDRAASREEVLVDTLALLPPAMFIPAIEDAMRQMGCAVERRDEDVLVARLAANVAALVGHSDPLTGMTGERIAELVEPAGEQMVEAGQLAIVGPDNTLVLADCTRP